MTKTVFITIAGRTNAGKSSLLNALVGEKIASVSPKTQTTRTKITGIVNINETQLVFIDTPGLHKPKNKLSDHMLKAVKDSVTDIDAVIFMFDCTRKISQQEEEMLASLTKSTPVILALNKIDLLEDKSVLIKIITEFSSKYKFSAIVPLSVTENDGIDLIISEVEKLAVESPHYFPDDMITDQPEKIIAGEIIREKMLNLLDDEVPHGIAVAVETMRERETASHEDILDISAVIFCERESHKGIILGKKGSMMKKIATQSRMELEDFFRIKVNLQCWVKVKEDWRNREAVIRSLGLSDN
ncbi:MAG: GTPase Era [Oscillospiraceae bacterium]